MAFTQSDLDRIESAIKRGVLTVRQSDGDLITYQSMADLLAAKRHIQSDLAQSTSTRLTPRYQRATFSD